MKTRNKIFLVTTLCMMCLCMFGVYGLITAPHKAQIAMDEAERRLKEAQGKAEKKKLDAIAAKGRDELSSDEVTLEMLKKRYTDSDQMFVTGIGDSVMLAATDALYNEFPNGYFDAVFGSTIYDCTDRLVDLEDKNMLGDVVVLSVGTNCDITAEDCENIIAHCDGRPTFWMTTYGVTNDSNSIMESVVSKHDDAFMIDWESEATPHPEWILDDHLHPNDEGAVAYADFIHSEINKDLKLKGNK